MSVNWFVEVIDGVTGKVEKKLGPMPERKAEKVEDGLNINLNHERYYTRSYPEGQRPEIALPSIGSEISAKDLADLITNDRPERMRKANREFMTMMHGILKIGGVWGWPATQTIWKKTATGFRRDA